MDTQKAMSLIRSILDANPTAVLTGSRALLLQGFKLRNEPTDIDFWIPEGSVFQIVPGMSLPKTKKQIETEKAENIQRQADDAISKMHCAKGSLVVTLDVLRDLLRQNPGHRQTIRTTLYNSFNGAVTFDELQPSEYVDFYTKVVDILNIKNSDTDTALLRQQVIVNNKTVADKEDYGEFSGQITRYLYNDQYKIEVHTGDPHEVRIPVVIQSIKCSPHIDILKAKFKFIHNGSPTIAKHKNDIIFFLAANF